MNTFLENLTLGREWETKVSHWLQLNQKYVLEVYDYTGTTSSQSKTPKMKIVPSEESLILPDLQIASSGVTHWVEVKSKSSVGTPFKKRPWYKTTGFDLKYWDHYSKVQDITGLAVNIFFVHYNQGEIRSASLEELNSDKKKRKHVNSGNGMIYWDYSKLKIIATIDNEGTISSL